MKKLIFSMLLLFILFVGCDPFKEKIQQNDKINSLRVNDKFVEKSFPDITLNIHRSGKTYTTWLYNYRYLTVRNSDSVIVSIWVDN